MTDPAARTRFRRRSDYLAVLLIVLLAGGLSALVWHGSDVRATLSETAAAGPGLPVPPDEVPQRLTEVWRARSAATDSPMVAGPVVVTGHNATVTGRAPQSGDTRWRYTRDIPLCTVSVAWSKVLTLYQKDGELLPSDAQQATGNCSEITALDSVTGERRDQRNGNAELGTRLLTDGNYVTATGKLLLNTWRSDLVQTAEYGLVPDARNPQRQPRPGCTHGSVAVGGDLVGVVERCPLEPADRLSVFGAVNPNPDESDRPVLNYSVALPARHGRIVAMTEDTVAVAVADPSRLIVYDAEEDKQLASYPVDVPAGKLRGDPAGGVTPTSLGSVAVSWFTGDATVALDPESFRPLWTTKDTVGPGTEFAGATLVPTRSGIAVLDRETGRRVRDIPVDRGGYTGDVRLATIGPVVLEQRGSTLVALR